MFRGKSLLPAKKNFTKNLNESIQTRKIAVLLFQMLDIYK